MSLWYFQVTVIEVYAFNWERWAHNFKVSAGLSYALF